MQQRTARGSKSVVFVYISCEISIHAQFLVFKNSFIVSCVNIIVIFENFLKMSQPSQRYNGSKQKPCANPLFEQWLSEWREDAVQKNSKLQYVYGKVSSGWGWDG